MKSAKATIHPEKKSSQPRIQIRLHPEKDADIIEYLNKEKHITNAVKNLIREKIWLEKSGLQFVPTKNSLINDGIADIHNNEFSSFAEDENSGVFLNEEAFTQPEKTSESLGMDLFEC